MNDPNEFNLPEFDVLALVTAQDLGISESEAFEAAVQVETRENSLFIPVDELEIFSVDEEEQEEEEE